MILLILIAIPLVVAAVALLGRYRRTMEWTVAAGGAGILVCGILLLVQVMLQGSVQALGGFLEVDALAAFTILTVAVVSSTASLYSVGYMRYVLGESAEDQTRLHRYHALQALFIAAMLASPAMSNLAVYLIAIELTTIVSAFLVSFERAHESLEAGWKYIVIVSAGISLALLGTILLYFAGMDVLGPVYALDWRTMMEVAPRLDADLMKVTFLLILIGYGTKVGLAPMHTWLPDAHSEAPSPVSALLSGALLNTAMFGILRFYTIVGLSTGPDYPRNLLIVAGLSSMTIAAFAIVQQRDAKRLFAYSSVEHMGIIAVGFGVGGPLGYFGALLHMLNHSLAKSMMFYGAGNVLRRYGTKEIGKITGLIRIMPVTGSFWMLGGLAILGAPPFSLFLSEFAILSAGFAQHMWVPSILFLFLLLVVFVAFFSYMNTMVFGVPPAQVPRGELNGWTVAPLALSFVPVLWLGLYIPDTVQRVLDRVIAILPGGPF
jgi:hydrogenase-4 component F